MEERKYDIMNVSLIITSYNDNENLRRTIQSACLHTDLGFEMVVVDDASQEPFKLVNPMPGVLTIRNDVRRGISQSRDIAIEASRSRWRANWVIIVDAHMLFPHLWLERIINHIQMARWNTVLSGMYTVLDKNHLDPERPLYFWGGSSYDYVTSGKDWYKIDFTKVQKLRTEQQTTNPALRGGSGPVYEYDIPTMIGACYVVCIDWWEHIRGWAGLLEWGSEETCFSRKTWLSGGSVRLMNDVNVGHITQPVQPNRTPNSHIVYNAFHSLRCTIPQDEWMDLISSMDMDTAWCNGMVLYQERLPSNEGLYQYLDSIRIRSNDWYCCKFGIRTILDTIKSVDQVVS